MNNLYQALKRATLGVALAVFFVALTVELYAGCTAAIDCGGTPARVESCSCPGVGACSQNGSYIQCTCGTTTEYCTCADGCSSEPVLN